MQQDFYSDSMQVMKSVAAKTATVPTLLTNCIMLKASIKHLSINHPMYTNYCTGIYGIYHTMI